MKPNFKIAEVLAIGLMMNLGASSVFAQEHVGNGGGEDIEFHKITSEIKTWIKNSDDQSQLAGKLQLENVIAPKLREDFLRAVDSTTLTFQNEPVMVGGQSRVCGNENNPDRIICNRNLWNHQVAGNIKYAIVFHEYLGIAGYEKNIMEYSQYPISKNLLDYVYEKNVFELRNEKKPTVKPTVHRLAEINVGGGVRRNHTFRCSIDDNGDVEIYEFKAVFSDDTSSHRSVNNRETFKLKQKELEHLRTLVDEGSQGDSRGNGTTFRGDLAEYSLSVSTSNSIYFDEEIERYSAGQNIHHSLKARKLSRMVARMCRFTGKRIFWKIKAPIMMVITAPMRMKKY